MSRVQLCLSQTLNLASDFLEDVQAFAAAGASAMAVWLTKLEQAVQKYGLARVQEALASRNLRAVAAAGQGGLLWATGEQRRLAFEQLQHRLGLCQALGIETLILACDFPHGADTVDYQRALAQLCQAAQLAASYHVRLALEMQARAAWCASLDTLAQLVTVCGAPNVGINFDSFHYYIGPSKPEDLTWLTRTNLFFVELSDLAGVPREWARDSHRILPGDGELVWEPLLARLRQIEYSGYVAVEAPNPDFWAMPTVRVAEAALGSLQRLLEKHGLGFQP
ncbi:MAG: sugar phosphate isomerase/epimerase family protein [Gemmatales bacterium]|nr:sugar phosphate isomerase/epimerase [Gemmatales bacterium]MCS7159557.1 sugar phosphate isomerase/epimerase [Gemmatales bacterium]MDW8174755.1 sugar phosphate isomerase/epimerase family protein [Gemmatales bacterium]MDW8222134.1 sugar phosphate isomerase/epimerase family protein [Gemmatales bacterium]